MTIRPGTEPNDTLAQLEAAVSSENAASLKIEDARKEKMPLVWIPVTICLGLLIATVYLGARILTARSHSAAPVQATTARTVQTKPVTPPTPVIAAATVPTATLPAATPKPEEPAQPKADAPTLATTGQFPMIDPQPGERYIQVSALNEEAAQRYVRQLRGAKLEPHVAPGPRPELLRVLIGPFADQDALERTKSDLERAGITNFVRKY
jgi:cell division septation protein DedD